MKKQIISLSENAVKQLSNILKSNNEYKSFLLKLKSGGCNGFEYKLTAEKDLILSNAQEYYKKKDIKINICNKSLMYLIGTHIDWKEDIISKSFVFDNPNAKIKCGCGTSFTPYSNFD